jgi:hypothetical protein
MEPAYVAAIFGLIGALVGSMSSIITMLIQSKVKDKRDRMQQVTSLTIEHYKAIQDDAQKRAKDGPLPPAVFLSYYHQLLELIESGKLNPETFSALNAKQSGIEAVVLPGKKTEEVPATVTSRPTLTGQ